MVTVTYPDSTTVWPQELFPFNAPGIMKSKSMLIYIAAPYSLGDVVSNVRLACQVGDEILAKGHIPFIPHLCHFWHFLSPKPQQEWLRIDEAILVRCDAVLRVGGISVGADGEVKTARSLGIPVYYSLESIPDEQNR